MKHWRKIAFCVVALLACCVFAQASDSGAYTIIVERNVFGLAPILPEPICAPPEQEPLPKITPNGLMTVFGRKQVLFNALKLKNSPGAKTQEDSYVLAEGESEDDIKVVQIDLAAGMVTFDNHGTIQQISLTARK